MKLSKLIQDFLSKRMEEENLKAEEEQYFKKEAEENRLKVELFSSFIKSNEEITQSFLSWKESQDQKKKEGENK